MDCQNFIEMDILVDLNGNEFKNGQHILYSLNKHRRS